MKLNDKIKTFLMLLLLISNSMITSFVMKENARFLLKKRDEKRKFKVGENKEKNQNSNPFKNGSLKVDEKSYQDYFKEFTIISNNIEQQKTEHKIYALVRLMERVNIFSRFWPKDDERHKIINIFKTAQVKGIEVVSLYERSLLLPSIYKIMNDMGSVELFDEVINKCEVMLKKYSYKKDCLDWIQLCKDKKAKIEILTPKSKTDIQRNVSTDIRNEISNIDLTNSSQLPIDTQEKLNLACKKAISDATPPKFCWRTGGTVVPSCGENYIEHTAGLCYEKCKEGYEYDFSMCKKICHKNEYSLALTCAKRSFIFDSRGRDAYTPESNTMFSKETTTCPQHLPHLIGALCYRQCPPGTVDCGCCACSINEKTCGIEIVKMIVSIAKGLAKLIAFAMTAGGASAIVETFSKTIDIIVSVVEGITSVISKIFEAMSDVFESYTKGIDEKEGKKIYMNFVKNIAYKKYIFPQFTPEQKNVKNMDEVKKALSIECDILSDEQWTLWKKANKKKNNDWTKMEKGEAMKIFGETLMDTNITAAGFIELLKSEEPMELLKSVQEGSANIGNAAGSVLGLIDLIKHAVETKEGQSYTDTIETSKKVLSIIEIWDPTGLTTIANAFLQPICNDDPEFIDEYNKVIAKLKKKRKNRLLEDKK